MQSVEATHALRYPDAEVGTSFITRFVPPDLKSVDTAVLSGMKSEQRLAARAAAATPWYCLAAVFGATCIPVGALWDISWHSTIGRDTFWTPAHITIQLGGLIPGFTAAWLALRATYFGSDEERGAAVRVWKWRAPLGAWVILWGTLAMLFSAPLDNWWHNAYGLDVEILSPPHTVLAAGMYAVALGSLLLVLGYQNRTGERSGSLLFIYAAGVLLTMATIIVTEKSYPNQQHGSFFYEVSAAIYPLYLVAASRASKIRWAASGAALVYMLMVGAMVWILPLFPAEPRLAPIYNRVDHMVPPGFPLLLVAPGLAIDLAIIYLGRKRGFWRDSALAVLLGAAFVGPLLAAQYYFSELLISPTADNWFLAGNRWWPYFIKPSPWRHGFWNQANDPLTITGVLIAFGIAAFKSRIALAFGNWMSKVRR